MAKINSAEKGKRGEREWASFCREQGYNDVKRGQQYSGIEGDDCVGLPFLHQEVKRVQALNIENAMAQSRRDAKEGEMPIVAFRRNHEKWKVCMDAEDWFEIYREYEAGRSINND
jgi:hypothetical protein